ncbi:MAG: 5-formyltetrahydrofolate cyclo-ligase [Pseudomonadota bacterium]
MIRDKGALRKAAFAARKQAYGEDHNAALTAALIAEIGTTRDEVIAGYMPIRTEADPRPAMGRLSASNTVCVPVIDTAGQPLLFRAWTENTEMIEGPFGAQVPAHGAWCQPRILIVPLVAFDRQFNRLGYGGGFYDRTLEMLRARGPVRAVGLAFSAQELPDLPTEATDQPLDAVITERGTLARRDRTA